LYREVIVSTKLGNKKEFLTIKTATNSHKAIAIPREMMV
jgi:hypothetical protein